MKTHIINESVDMPRLRRKLFDKDRLPNNNVQMRWYAVQLPNHKGKTLCYMDLFLIPRRRANFHRLMAHCHCGRVVPVGRLAQHTH